MSDKPAFPHSVAVGPSGDVYSSGELFPGADGLTRRELFAAMAMQGILANEGADATSYEANVSVHAVAHADALTAELDKEQE